MTFNDLNLSAPLLHALADLGYTQPTTIQQKAFPVILSGRDVCGIAQTGTGKTFAYLLPLLRLWTFSKDVNPAILILVPTRELVVQVTEAIGKLTKYMNVVAVGAFGGVNLKPQAAAVENGCDIVVATPGRLLDLVLNGSLKLKSLRKLVIDEVDEMLNLGFRAQLTRLIELFPERRQNLLFSATITEEVAALMEEYFRSPERVEAAPTGTPLESISQTGYLLPNFTTKVNLLQLLGANPELSKVLVFTATKKLADELYERLAPVFPEEVAIIHSNKDQRQRFAAVEAFRNGSARFLIATDIVARGIDIAGVSHVINFDMPEVPENYIHRIGRTGRADREGIALAFITPAETEQQEAVEALMRMEVPLAALPEGLEISDVVLDWEKPKVKMKTYLTALPSREGAGAAFHEKAARNQKVNKVVSHKEKMQQKYGKPKKRPKKR